MCIYIYIYIYIERERDREREVYVHIHLYTYIYIYMYTHVCTHNIIVYSPLREVVALHGLWVVLVRLRQDPPGDALGHVEGVVLRGDVLLQDGRELVQHPLQGPLLHAQLLQLHHERLVVAEASEELVPELLHGRGDPLLPELLPDRAHVLEGGAPRVPVGQGGPAVAEPHGRHHAVRRPVPRQVPEAAGPLDVLVDAAGEPVDLVAGLLAAGAALEDQLRELRRRRARQEWGQRGQRGPIHHNIT